MPNSSSTELDRVTGGQGPSQILGTLYSNGQIFVVNPDGILFGTSARSTSAASWRRPTISPTATSWPGTTISPFPAIPHASIVNHGTITAQTGGFAALVAPGVRNTGTITAKLGTIALASGNAFTLDLYGDNLITLGLTTPIASHVDRRLDRHSRCRSLVSNAGTLKANGGKVELTAVAARAVVDSRHQQFRRDRGRTRSARHNGMIVLGAATAATKPRGRADADRDGFRHTLGRG